MSGAAATEVPTGNTFDKYGSQNPVVKRLMEGAYPLRVPLEVEVKTGRHWGEMTPARADEELVVEVEE